MTDATTTDRPTFKAVLLRDLRSPKQWGNGAYDFVFFCAVFILSESIWLTIGISLLALVARYTAWFLAIVFLGPETEETS